jgi:flavin reductase (DIM6/NTAB) family NADH-FMN oxidoreductase RutF/rubredoxin
MDSKAFFKLTYGLFVAGTTWEGKQNACIINTATQATSEPGRLLATMMKTNYTTELIQKSGSLTISVLALDCPLSLIGNFGFSSGRDRDKFKDIPYALDEQGNPYILEHTIARFSCRVEQTIDLGTHNLFICAVTEAEVTGSAQPMTYAAYRVLKTGGTVPGLEKPAAEGQGAVAAMAKAPEKPKKRWVCSVCHYVYDGEIPFEELPEDYVCPVCKRPKSVFVLEE